MAVRLDSCGGLCSFQIVEGTPGIAIPNQGGTWTCQLHHKVTDMLSAPS